MSQNFQVFQNLKLIFKNFLGKKLLKQYLKTFYSKFKLTLSTRSNILSVLYSNMVLNTLEFPE